MLGIKDGEVVTSFVTVVVLVFYILHDHLISDRTRGSYEVASAPEVLAPEGFIEFWELLEYLPGRLAFEILGHF